jgi:hypothetical protein
MKISELIRFLQECMEEQGDGIVRLESHNRYRVLEEEDFNFVSLDGLREPASLYVEDAMRGTGMTKDDLRKAIEFLQKCKPFLGDDLIEEYDEVKDALTLLLRDECEKKQGQ